MYGLPMVFWFKPFQSVLLASSLKRSLSKWLGFLENRIQEKAPRFDAGKPYHDIKRRPHLSLYCA